MSSRVRNLVDYQSRTADFDGDGTTTLNADSITVSGAITAGSVDSANVPKVENTLEPVTDEVKTVFTNEWQLQDAGTNLVGCKDKEEKVKMAKNTIGTQGNSHPSGFSF